MTLSRVVVWMAVWTLTLTSLTPVAAQDYVDRYAIAPNSKDLDFGSQPLSYPNGVIGTVMRHDRLLKSRLMQLGSPLKSHPFRRGADMLAPIADRRLDVGLLGDTPATVAAAAGSVWIVGLVEVQQNAIVSRDAAGLADLKGKRIGYVPVSTAHTTLMRALGAIKLSPADVKLHAYSIDELPGALARHEIDAFAGWEPAVSVALTANPRHHVVFRGQSVDYFVVSRLFAQAHPDATLAIIAAYVRAIEWMRQSRSNLERAARWVLEDGQAFTGSPIQMSVAQVAAVTRSGILDVPSAPVILPVSDEQPLTTEYALLKSLGQLPAQQSWDNVTSSFQYKGLSQVMLNPRKYELRKFDYER